MDIKSQVKLQRKKVFTLARWQYLLGWPVYKLYTLYLSTLRFHREREDAEAFRKAMACERPITSFLWHNRQFIITEIFKRYSVRQVTLNLLVSPAMDAAWFAGFFSKMGINPVRGSSTSGAIAAVRELLACYKAGEDLGITPDGPSGPLYEIKKGTVMMARLTKTDILLVVPNPRAYWRLKNWDGSYFPKPFSTIDLRFKYILHSSLVALEEDDAIVAFLENEMRTLTEDAKFGANPRLEPSLSS